MSATTTKAIRVHIRWMICRDMPEVLDIDLRAGLKWSEEDFIRQLRQCNCIGMIAEVRERVVGQMIYELHKTKLHILNFGVHPDFQHRTVGSELIYKLKSKLSVSRRTSITLQCPESAIDMALFLRHHRFLATDLIAGQCEDVIEFEYFYDPEDVAYEREQRRQSGVIPERISMDSTTQTEAAATKPTGFPKAKKIEPLYEVKVDDGVHYYVRMSEKDGKADPEAVRHEDSETKKLIWLKPLGLGMKDVK